MYDELVKRLRIAAQLADKGLVITPSICLEAADAIEELQADKAALNGTVSNLIQQIAELSKPRWIPVTEQLIHSGWYLVACNEWGGSAVRKAIYDEATRKWLEFPCGGPKNITKFVTHWMPLPEPPKEG